MKKIMHKIKRIKWGDFLQSLFFVLVILTMLAFLLVFFDSLTEPNESRRIDYVVNLIEDKVDGEVVVIDRYFSGRRESHYSIRIDKEYATVWCVDDICHLFRWEK